MATETKPEHSVTDQILIRLGGVETQMTGIQSRLGAVEIDLAVVKSNYARREDIAQLGLKMAQMETRLIKWFIGTAVTLSAVVGTIAFSVARFIH
jgi:hypothetical protein